jgi:hypothetical protein
MLFSPENALADFRRKVKDLWNIPKKSYYVLLNGKHENIPVTSWPSLSSIQVCIKGLLGGGKEWRTPEILYITLGNEEAMACNRFLSSLKTMNTVYDHYSCSKAVNTVYCDTDKEGSHIPG